MNEIPRGSGISSLDFMSFLGELEDTFDIELEETEVTKITTLEEALKSLEDFSKVNSCRTAGVSVHKTVKEKYADRGNILEESVQKFGEVKAVKWLKRKEVLERSYSEMMKNVISTRKGLLAEGLRESILH